MSSVGALGLELHCF
jgi:hypothetical protein